MKLTKSQIPKEIILKNNSTKKKHIKVIKYILLTSIYTFLGHHIVNAIFLLI